ncbi:hypothetical protein [Klenkia taihuensis]|uniref:Uncharacterized protein n=1 Tax=Klenkia taihuensis TaxID=1225127 RepID=A0A1I1HNF2_9ACTN|nr:hypothetical protein [Klenkia taihuensis]GHE09170.1 hypothetical protein GCM10011381_12880 [Klenkia taihuensis]SFC23508.1 hypothetical protein SAMN05661030_0447 [Klenkia taihuensis]
MRAQVVRRELHELVFPLVLVLVGELVVQVSRWDRFWVLLGALVAGYLVRAVIRTSAQRVERTDGERSR